MPRARSPNRDKAFKLWLAGKGQRTLQDIAAELGVTPEQVRAWKHNDRWDAKTEKVQSHDGKGSVIRRKRGGQVGNKNAVGNIGGAAPQGNTNGFRHGAYERVMGDLLKGDEREIFQDDSTGDEVEAELKRTLAALNAKEVRLVKRIEQFRQLAENGNELESVTETESETKGGEFEEIEPGVKKKRPGTNIYDGEVVNSVVSNKTSIFDALSKLEAELDKVYGRKIKVLAQLDALRTTRERLDLEKRRLDGETAQSKIANAWIAALTGENMEGEDEPDEGD